MAKPGSRADQVEHFRLNVREAMKDAWNDICSDTGNHPLDIVHKGRTLLFAPEHWSVLTADILAVRLAEQSKQQDPSPHDIRGWQVRAAREALGWSQGELCRRAKVGIKFVVALERRYHKPQRGKLKLVRDALESAGVVFVTMGIRLTHSPRMKTVSSHCSVQAR